jgi:6-phosphogluconolactonase
MNVQRRNASFVIAVTAIALAACSDRSSTTNPLTAGAAVSSLDRAVAHDDADGGGAVYTSTNSAAGNSIIAFHRAGDGTLTRIGSFPTGGLGIGGTVDPLLSQFALALSADHRAMFVVNAGSNQLSSFRVKPDGGLELAGVVSSGGQRPVSLSVHDHVLYVLNTGDNTLVGFRVAPHARLVPIRGSLRALAPGADGAAAVRFTPDGAQLVVSERVSNRLEVLPVRQDGRLGEPVVSAGSGGASFGFDITDRNQPIVSETQGSLTSYALSGLGALTPITASISTGGTAPCWVIITSNGRFAYATNTGTSSIAAFAVGSNGALTALAVSPVSVGSGVIPLDLDQVGSRLLYTLETGKGTIGAFGIGQDGRLTALSEVEAGAPASGFQGIAAF